MFGLNINCQDGQDIAPEVIDLSTDAELHEWFLSNDRKGNIPIRLLCIKTGEQDTKTALVHERSNVSVPVPAEAIEHLMHNPDVYHSLTQNTSGGAIALQDDARKFMLQTPTDGGPFCSLVIARQGNLVKGVYTYNDDIFDPASLRGGEGAKSGWRSTGLQVVTLPGMFLKAHSAYLSQSLNDLIKRVEVIEQALADADPAACDFPALNRSLHGCHLELVSLQRRSRFEETIVDAIDTTLTSPRPPATWQRLDIQRNAIASRSFDLETLPQRIDNCRATISSLMQRQNERLNFELTEASHRIAEATLADSKSMKTIAILTMVLLPGTAVASLFSMNMFNWRAGAGEQIASRWIWVYFVIAVPLTGLTLAAWWLWTRNKSSRVNNTLGNSSRPRFTDVESTGPSEPAGDNLELQAIRFKAEGSSE